MLQGNSKLVVFILQVNDKAYEYGIPIEQVHEITRPVEITRLPGMPEFVEGIVNLRGKVIPIMDLKKRFRLGTTEKQDTTRILVVNWDNRNFGVVVDDVVEIIPLNAENLEEPPSIAGGIAARYILGIGKIEERLIIAVDMQKILTERETEELSTAI
jgi:purine-binding chemotaxis protein CheW